MSQPLGTHTTRSTTSPVSKKARMRFRIQDVLLLTLFLVTLVYSQQAANKTTTESPLTTTTSPLPPPEQKSSRQVSPFGASLNGIMSTATGVLAAVGGGYLMYAAMVTLFENVVDPAFNRVVGTPGGHPPARRSGFSLGGLPRFDVESIVERIRKVDYPETTFRMLKLENENCRKRAVCEFEQLLGRTGMPKVILKSISGKIPGMEKYDDAVWWALQKDNCKALHRSCPQSLGQTLLRAVGLS